MKIAKTYKLKSSAIRAAKKEHGEGNFEVFQYEDSGVLGAWGFSRKIIVAPKGRIVSPALSRPYRAPCAAPGFLNTMLSTVSRDTLIDVNVHVGADASFKTRYDVGLKAGMALGILGQRYNPATRQQETFIVR